MKEVIVNGEPWDEIDGVLYPRSCIFTACVCKRTVRLRKKLGDREHFPECLHHPDNKERLIKEQRWEELFHARPWVLIEEEENALKRRETDGDV